MYEKLTKWIRWMGPYSSPSGVSYMWPPRIDDLMEEVCSFRCPFGSSKCLSPEEISLAARDKDFLDTLQGPTIIAAMRDVFGADRICEGTVDCFVKSGAFWKFLVRLKELDEGRPVIPPKKPYDFHKRTSDEEVARNLYEPLRKYSGFPKRAEEAQLGEEARKRQQEERQEKEEEELADGFDEKQKRLSPQVIECYREEGDPGWVQVGRARLSKTELKVYGMILLAFLACCVICVIAKMIGR